MNMNNKEHFDWLVKNGLLKPEQDTIRVELLANRLINSLYKPTIDKRLFIANRKFIDSQDIDCDEPINWGSLSATVSKKEGLYIVTIEEANPGNCPTLCEYVAGYLTAWGWPVLVETEW
jgi:hypothetical protein